MALDNQISSDSAQLQNTSPVKSPISAKLSAQSYAYESRSLSSDDDWSSSLHLSSGEIQSTPESSLRSGSKKRSGGPPRKRGSIDSMRSNARSDELSLISRKMKNKRRLEQATADFTINKLKTIDLVGRDEEISILRSCFQRLIKQESGPIIRRSFSEVHNEMVFIQGLSGVGKTALAGTLKVDISKAPTGVYVEGKYEFTTMDVPMSGIAQAFGVLCDIILKEDKETISAIKKDINENMQEEAKALMELIPELQNLLENEHADHTTVGGSRVVDNRQDQWNHAFRTFTRMIGSHFKEIVLVLDDLQWSDVASLDIIQTLISDVQNPNPLMIICCYRSNEVDESSSLYTRIETFRAISEQYSFHITDIEVEACDVDAVNTMIMNMMSIDDQESTRDLARVCFKRTMGNPFFLIEFMTMLQSEGLLEFDFCAMKWIWDVAMVEEVTMSTENVVALVQARMRKLPDGVQKLLQYAACLGSSFSPATLEIVWKQNECRMTDNETNEIPDMLNVVREAKLIESFGANQLRWVHDKIQEAALSLSDLVTPRFQFRLGLCLYQSLDKSTLEFLLFDVVDLINKDPGQQRPDLAALNLRAAKKAQSISAFHSAAKYASYGINLLPSDPWDIHRRLTLQLYSLGAEMALAIGRVELVEEYVDTVLKHDPSVTLDTMPLHMTKVKMLASTQLRFSEAADLGLSLLKDLGVSVAWNKRLVPIQAITFCTRTIKKIKNLPSDHFDNMKRMKDPKQRAIVNLLYRVYYASYSAKNLPLCIVCICKMIELTLKHGINEHSGSNIASLATFVHILQNDHATVERFSEMAFAINKKYGNGSRLAETTFILYGFSMPFIVPYHSCLGPLLNGYNQGVKMGNLEPAYWCMHFHFVSMPILMGRPLDAIYEECEKVGLHFDEANLKGHSQVLRIMWQMVANLQMTPNDATRKLNGRIYREETDDSSTFLGAIHFAQNQLSLYFGDYEAVATSDAEKGDYYAECMPGNSFIPLETFHRGIAVFAMARRTRNRKYRSRATKLRKMISKFTKSGNPNVIHYDLMLRAEQAALDRRYAKADELYKEAIVHAARTGSLHHVALFNERYADYRLHDHDDVDDAKYLMTEAARYYLEWGAVGKADELRKEISFL